MSTKYILPKEGFFYKANMHCHSTLSDGMLTPEELKLAYKAHGYSIIAYTDHRVCVSHNELTDSSFLSLTGTELDNRTFDHGVEKACHICCISKVPQGRDMMPQLPTTGIADVNHTLAGIAEDNFILHYNHPIWSCETPMEFNAYEGISGFEVYNHCSEVYAMEGDAVREYSYYIKSGKRVYPVAGDDNHNRINGRRYLTDSFGGFTMIKAKNLAYENIIGALEHGDVYASTGPELHEISITDKKMHIKCTPVSKVIIKKAGVGICSQNIIMDCDCLTDVTIDLTDMKQFVFVQIMDANGHYAVSRSIDESEWNN